MVTSTMAFIYFEAVHAPWTAFQSLWVPLDGMLNFLPFRVVQAYSKCARRRALVDPAALQFPSCRLPHRFCRVFRLLYRCGHRIICAQRSVYDDALFRVGDPMTQTIRHRRPA
ncbi:hypothetical protein MRX96_012297 [Rhipicephalus microplus]